MIVLFRPHQWVKYNWIMFNSVSNFLGLVFVIFLNQMIDLANFFLKFILWIPEAHYLLLVRLIILLFLSLLGIRELYEYIYSKHYKRVGPALWLLCAIVSVEY